MCQIIKPGLDPYESYKSCPDTIHQGADSETWGQESYNSRDFLWGMSKAGPKRGREWPRGDMDGEGFGCSAPHPAHRPPCLLFLAPHPQRGPRVDERGCFGERGARVPSVTWHRAGLGG